MYTYHIYIIERCTPTNTRHTCVRTSNGKAPRYTLARRVSPNVGLAVAALEHVMGHAHTNKSRGMRPPNRWRRWRGKFVWRWRGNFPQFLKAIVGLSNSCWWDDWDWWNYGELWGIMGELWGNYGELWGIMVELWGIWLELWGIMGNYGGIMGNYGEWWWNYGELWGIVGNCGGIMVELWGIMDSYGGIMGNYGELWGIMGCHFLCC